MGSMQAGMSSRVSSSSGKLLIPQFAVAKASSPLVDFRRCLDDLSGAYKVWHGYSLRRGVPWGVEGYRHTEGNSLIFTP